MLGFGHLALRQTFNRRLLLTVLLITFSQFNFGFDQQGYSNTQAMDSFVRQFGVLDGKTNKYKLETTWLSYFNGFMYIGQAVGTTSSYTVCRRDAVAGS
jgi:SP family sugar:H+ symporter-like MFS transporter